MCDCVFVNASYNSNILCFRILSASKKICLCFTRHRQYRVNDTTEGSMGWAIIPPSYTLQKSHGHGFCFSLPLSYLRWEMSEQLLNDTKSFNHLPTLLLLLLLSCFLFQAFFITSLPWVPQQRVSARQSLFIWPTIRICYGVDLPGMLPGSRGAIYLFIKQFSDNRCQTRNGTGPEDGRQESKTALNGNRIYWKNPANIFL